MSDNDDFISPPNVQRLYLLPLASGDQVNLWNLGSLSTWPSGQNHCSRCSGKNFTSPATEPARCCCFVASSGGWSVVISLALAAGELQQLRGARWLHAISPHLWHVTRHLHHRGPPAGRAAHMILSLWPKRCRLTLCRSQIPNLFSPLHRSWPWDCSGPSPSSTWAALTALCGAAWFRGNSRKQLKIRGSNCSRSFVTA